MTKWQKFWMWLGFGVAVLSMTGNLILFWYLRNPRQDTEKMGFYGWVKHTNQDLHDVMVRVSRLEHPGQAPQPEHHEPPLPPPGM